MQSTDLKEYWGELRRAARDKLDAMHLELHRGAVAAVVSDLFEFIHPVDQGESRGWRLQVNDMKLVWGSLRLEA